MAKGKHREARALTKVEFKLSEVKEEGVRLLTTCGLAAYVDEAVVWPTRGSDGTAIEVQIDDLLSHLTEYWKPLALRQTYPLTLNPARPSLLRAEALQNWDALPEAQAVYEDEVIEAFRDCHDLSRCFAGYFDLPALWLIRSGEEMLIDTVEQLDRVPYAAALDALSAAGDWIAARLAQTENERWDELLRAWRNRNAGDGLSLLKWSTSLDEQTVERLVADGLLMPPASMAEAANDNDEVRLAARMASALPAEQVRGVLSRVSQFPKQEAPQLDELVLAVRTHFDAGLSEARPYEQGEAIAGFVRQFFGLPPTTEVDVFDIVARLGPQIYLENFEPPTLDALAVWGDRHGPAVLLNQASIRHIGRGDTRRRGQARVTLAHELCHLLIDGEHALSAVDVLHSRMPILVEQRARAFAAEFLLPSRVAGEAWLAADQPRGRDDLRAVLERLCRRFVVTKSVAAWKLEHGARLYDAHLAPILDSIVPQR